MNPVQFHAPPVSQPQAPPSTWFSPLPPNPPPSSSFWNPRNVHDRLSELQYTLNLAHALQEELEVLMRMKNGESNDDSCVLLSKYLEERKTDCKSRELASVDAANSLISKLQAQIHPFRFVTDEAVPWEEKSAVMKLSNKMLKSKRNKLWRKRKRRRVAEARTKEGERFEEADRKADEWIAKEVAKDAAQIKMEKMKKIAKDKAKEERKRLESELELFLIVEKLQELRSIRIQKLKKQGHFLPEEDDKFLEKVRAAVEEEERQAMAAADTDAAKDAIANAEETRKTNHSQVPNTKVTTGDDVINETKDIEDQVDEAYGSRGPNAEANPHKGNESDAQPSGGSFDSVSNLPLEFYHYYYGSNNDMGTLIEVRRAWDAYIRPGGRRLPGHWVQPPPPTDDVWASYLIRTNDKMS